MSTLIIKNIPEDIKSQFKALCALEKKTLAQKIIEMMQSEVKKHSK